MKYLATKLGNAEYDKFIEKCNSCGESRAEHLRNIVASYLNSENISSKEVIEKEDGSYILPAGTIFHQDGFVNLPDGGIIFNLDDETIAELDQAAEAMGKENLSYGEIIEELIKQKVKEMEGTDTAS